MSLLSLESEGGPDFVSTNFIAVELSGVESQTELSLNSRTEWLGVSQGKDTSVVDLCLYKSSRVEVTSIIWDINSLIRDNKDSWYVRLSTNFKSNPVGGFRCIVDGTTPGFDITAYTVIITCSELGEFVRCKEGDSVFRRAESNSCRVPGNLSRRDIVLSLSTDEETIMAKNGVGSNGRSLNVRKRKLKSVVCSDASRSRKSAGFGRVRSEWTSERVTTYLEEVQACTSMETRSFVCSIDDCTLWGRLALFGTKVVSRNKSSV